MSGLYCGLYTYIYIYIYKQVVSHETTVVNDQNHHGQLINVIMMACDVMAVVARGYLLHVAKQQW